MAYSVEINQNLNDCVLTKAYYESWGVNSQKKVTNESENNGQKLETNG